MSKKIFLLAVLWYCLYVGHASVPHLGTHFKEAMSDPHAHEFLHKHVLKSAISSCPDFQNKLNQATREVQQCVEQHFHPGQDNICSFMRSQFKQCTNPLINFLQQCAPDKYVMGGLVVDGLVKLFDTICQAKGYELLELINPCIIHSISGSKDNPCKLELEMKLAEYKKDFPTKEEFCRFESTFRTCLQKQLENRCTNAMMKENFFKFYDTIHSTCDN